MCTHHELDAASSCTSRQMSDVLNFISLSVMLVSITSFSANQMCTQAADSFELRLLMLMYIALGLCIHSRSNL